MDNITHLDLSNLRENSMGDESFVQEMIELFIKRGAERLEQLKNELSSDTNELWVSHSHALKGMAANIGAPYLRELCAQAQLMENNDPYARNEIFKRIESEYNIVVDELKNTI